MVPYGSFYIHMDESISWYPDSVLVSVCFLCFMTLSCQINVGVFSPYQVMELLVHLNKRIKSRPKIQLPVETLLVQYQDPAAASFVTVRIKF